jgi:ssDNA-binding Zn-finger/Zn-ribbon topoisomerase 1
MDWSHYRFPKERCPLCGDKMRLRQYPGGWVLVCLRHPACKGKRPAPSPKPRSRQGSLCEYPPLKMEFPADAPTILSYALACALIAVTNMRNLGLTEDATRMEQAYSRVSDDSLHEAISGRIQQAVQLMRESWRVFRRRGYVEEAERLAARGRFLVNHEDYKG